MFNQIVKNLCYGIKTKSGRTNSGKISIRHRGGAKKRRIRFFDYFRFFFNLPAIILIPQLYDPFRTTFLSLILYKNGVFSLIKKPRFLKSGFFIKSSTKKIPRVVGACCPLRIIPEGVHLNSIIIHNSAKPTFVKSAGTFANVINKFCVLGNKILVKLPSSEEYLFNCNSLCSFGRLDNIGHKFKRYLKAGHLRNRGYRPNVRGVAMNPIDHPHGGNTSIGKQPVNIWATCFAKGGRTRKSPLNKNNIFHRRKKKK